jgi:hypothetical protein
MIPPERKPMSPRQALRALAPNVLLLIVATLLALGLGEIIARTLLRAQAPSPRCLLWSRPNFELDDVGAVRFARSARVREVAVYDGVIEYDMVYPTNNLGFVDTEDYLPATPPTTAGRYAFVGDSFTAGSGGYAWPASLRTRRRRLEPNVAIYNLGLPAAGPRQFLVSLTSAARQLSFTHIVILCISHDLKRSIWTPRHRNGRVYFRFESAGGPIRHLAGWEIDFDASPPEILSRAEGAERDLRGDETRKSIGEPQGSRLFWLIRERLQRHRSPAPTAEAFDATALLAIRSRFPRVPITFIHLPEKQEVQAGHYGRDVRSAIEGRGIRYVSALDECRWATDMYHPHDMHPNSKGYANIEACVEHCLFSASSSASAQAPPGAP